MTIAATRTARSDGVLTLADALAVLVAACPTSTAARDGAATHALRQATGRSDIAIGRRVSARPFLLPPYPTLAVSLAHRGGVVIAGFSPKARVGVDIESGVTAQPIDAAAMARNHFAPGEALTIAHLPPERARDLFLRLWVAKEALLKTTGRGLFDGLDDPDLTGAIQPLLSEGTSIRLQGGRWHDHAVVVRTIERAGDIWRSASGAAPELYVALARAPG